ncbi:MAG TPA: metal-sensitive transcriptional regulator [Acidimicrobiales bacterium]|jgi:DNA-binding FrmR family transcriptional regulator
MTGYRDNATAIQRRLRRIEGQVRGLQRMVDEDAYCIDVLTQVSAVTKALQAVALELLDGHLSHCVAEAIAGGGDNANQKIAEATAAIGRLVRS